MSTWLGAYRKGRELLELSHDRARVYADDIATKTQASAQPSDVAPVQRTPGSGQAMKYIRRRKKGMSHTEAMLGIRSKYSKK